MLVVDVRDVVSTVDVEVVVVVVVLEEVVEVRSENWEIAGRLWRFCP